MKNIYYYWKINESQIIIDKTEHLASCAIEITYEQYNNLLQQLTEDKLIWQDKQGNLQVRNRLTKYDESTDTWIPDQDAIDAENKAKLIASAQNAYDSSYKYTNPYEWNKLSQEQQQELTIYLDTLGDIIDGKSELTELPTKPDFIK